MSFTTLVWLVDGVFCRYLMNPLVAAALAVASYAFIAFSQIRITINLSGLAALTSTGYGTDFLQQLVNLVFIWRFALGPNMNIKTLSSLEVLLLVLQEIGCGVLLFCPEYSLFHADISTFFKVIILWQIFCPYFILALNVCDNDDEEESTAVTEKPSAQSRLNHFKTLLIDTNNNFLPIFIAHSFAAVGVDFPIYSDPIAPLIYKAATLSLKVYLIARFILYELVVVIYEMKDLHSYAEIYSSVQLEDEELAKSKRRCSSSTQSILVFTTLCIMLTDLSIIALAKLY